MFILKSNTRGLAGYWTLFSEAEIITDLSGGDIFIDVEVCHNLRPVICKSFLTLDHSQTGTHRVPPLAASGLGYDNTLFTVCVVYII